MTTFAASVTIVDLPAGTTVTGAELFEAVQTTNNVGQSVQLSLTQMMTLGGLPTGGATGTILNKSSGSNYSTQFSAINTFVLTDGNLMTTGSATSITIALATNVTVTGTLGVLGTANLSGGIVATGTLGQVGTSLLTGTFGVVGTAAFTGAFNINGTTIQTGTFVLGSQATGILVSSGTGVVSAQGGLVLLNTLSPSAVASTNDTTSLTSAYRNYMITFENVTPANNTTAFQMTVATSGSNFVSGSYISIAQVNVSSVTVTDTSTTVLLLSGTRATTALQSSTLYGLSGFVKLFGPSGTVARKQIVGDVSYAGAGGSVGTTTLAQAAVNGLFDGNSNAITGVNFSFSSGNIATGTIKIYGIT